MGGARSGSILVLAVAGAALAAALAAGPTRAEADVASERLEYRDGDVVLEGVLCAEPGREGRRPGILVFPSWTGVNRQAEASAQRLARMGYVALVADVYGKGVRPAAPADAGREAGKYKGDRALTRGRALAALAALRRDPRVDAARCAAIGYCFGGMCALELARSGADVAAVVSFHGSLDSPAPADAARARAKILVLHGAEDPWVPQEDVAAFVKEMREARLDWQLVQYGGAVHSFTDEDAGSDASRGAAYHPAAAARAWRAMADLLAEVFPPAR